MLASLIRLSRNKALFGGSHKGLVFSKETRADGDGLAKGNPDAKCNNGDQQKGRDALFMGLGDVIFPGMLVISSLTYMPELGGEVYNPYGSMYLSQVLVALGTLVGGLFGYVALMRFVARGNAQPGLPLLNGGAILGYIITGIIVVGPAALWQDISFL